MLEDPTVFDRYTGNLDILPREAVSKLIGELQRIKHSVVTGDTATTSLTLPGIATDDTVVSVVNLTDGANINIAEVTIPAAGEIALGSTDTSSKKLLVVWFDKNA